MYYLIVSDITFEAFLKRCSVFVEKGYIPIGSFSSEKFIRNNTQYIRFYQSMYWPHHMDKKPDNIDFESDSAFNENENL